MPFHIRTPRLYNDRELDGGVAQRRGISEALETYLRKRQESTDWENDVNMEGGTVDPQESGIDRVKRVGGGIVGAIRKKLPGYDNTSDRLAAEANLDSNRGRVLDMQMTPSEPADFEAARRDPGTSSTTNVATINPQGRQNRTLDTMGTARDGVTRSPIAEEIERTIVRGPNGQTGIMPTRRGRERQSMMDRAEIGDIGRERENREWDRRQGVEHAQGLERDRLRPRTNSMEAIEARARNSEALVRLREQLRAARATNDPSTVARAEREIARLELAERRLAAQIATSEINENRLPNPGIDETIATNTPEGAASVAATRAERERLQGERRRIAAPPGADAGAGKPTISQAQYDRATSQGKTDAEIRQYYNLAPGVRARAAGR